MTNRNAFRGRHRMLWAGLLMLGSSLTALGQSDGTGDRPCSCRQYLDQALGAMAQAIQEAPHNAFLLEMRFRAENGNGVQQFNATAHFEQGRAFFETPHYRYYEDPELRLATLPEERTAYVYETPDAMGRRAEVERSLPWRDTLLTRGEVIECRMITAPRPGGDRRIVTIAPPPSMAGSGVRRVTWTIDARTGGLLQARIDYGPGRPLTSLQVDYLRFVPGARDPRAQRSLADEFLVERGRKGGLNGYVINDRRRNRP